MSKMIGDSIPITPRLEFWVHARNRIFAQRLDQALRERVGEPWFIAVEQYTLEGDYFHWVVNAPSFALIAALRDELAKTGVVRLKKPSTPRGERHTRAKQWWKEGGVADV